MEKIHAEENNIGKRAQQSSAGEVFGRQEEGRLSGETFGRQEEERLAEEPFGLQEDELSVEEAFGQLEHLISRMEEEGISLEETFSCYEKGIRLIRYCNSRIDRVEKKVQMLRGEGQAPMTEIRGDAAFADGTGGSLG